MIPRRGRDQRAEDRLRESYDLVWREREELSAEVSTLRKQLDAQRERQATLERRLRNTLVFAENAAEKLKEGARTEAEGALRKARRRADEIVADAQRRRGLLEQEAASLERRMAARERSAREAADAEEAKARRIADVTLEQARERAAEIVRSAEERRRELDAEIERTRAGYREFLAALEHLASEAARLPASDLREHEPFEAPALRDEERGPEAGLSPSLPFVAGPPAGQRPRN